MTGRAHRGEQEPPDTTTGEASQADPAFPTLSPAQVERIARFGRRRVIEAGEVVQLERSAVHSLVQTDAELGEILLRAFILRRLALFAQGYGDVVLLGSTHCSGTLRAREFLTRNGHPPRFRDDRRHTGNGLAEQLPRAG